MCERLVSPEGELVYGPKLARFTYQVTILWFSVRHCSKSTQTIFIYKYPQWVTGGNQHINPEIKLESIYEKWLGYVLLTNEVFSWLDVLTIKRKNISWSIVHNYCGKQELHGGKGTDLPLKDDSG